MKTIADSASKKVYLTKVITSHLGCITSVGGQDYREQNMNLNFNDGTRRRCFNVTIIDDVVSEQIESFGVQLEVDSLSVDLVPRIATVHIVDDDCKPMYMFIS